MSKIEIPWRYLLRSVPTIMLIVMVAVRKRPWQSMILWFAGILAVIAMDMAVVWLLRRRGKSWPTANAVIEFATVAEDPKSGPLDHVLQLSYSYQVDGQRYGGAYRETFPSRDRAKRALRFFEDLPVPVRYHPRDPSQSVLDPHWLATLESRPSVTGAATR